MNPPNLAPNCLRDKVILVLGATGTIGHPVCEQLGKLGAQTILVSKTIKSLQKLYDAIEPSCVEEPALHPMNLMSIGIDECIELKEHIDKLFGRLDGVVFCCGKWGEFAPVEHYKESSWLELMHINVNIPFLLTKHLMPLLRKTKDSTVVYTESELSHSTKAYHGAFACSQKALRTMIEMLHLENSYCSIRFVGLNPGLVHSTTRRKLYPADPTPQQMIEPSELAPYFASLFLPQIPVQSGQCWHIEEVACAH